MQRIRALAWVAVGLSVLVDIWIVWSYSSASTDFYLAIFGPANENEFFYFVAVYLIAFALDIAAAIALKGWRNRVLAIAGMVVLLAPVVAGIWI